MSLRRRLVVGLVAVGAVLVLANLVLAATFESFLLDRVDRQLAEIAHGPVFRGARMRPPAAATPEALSEHYVAMVQPATGELRRLGAALVDDDAAPRVDTAQARDRAVSQGAPLRPYTVDADSGEGSWRIAAIALRDGRVAVVGISLDAVDATLARVRLVQFGAAAAVLAALAVVSWWTLRLGVHPLEAMARSADRIAAGDLSHRVARAEPTTEAGRLGLALNAMLERIQGAFRAREESEERVRRFAADASHELRTPLTSIRGYVDLWRAGGLRDDAELADAMRRLGDEASRMSSLVEDLLLLARLDQHRPLERHPVRLDTVVADGVQDARAVEPDRPIALDVDGPVVVTGDEARLRQVVGNLLANARVHTPPGTPVRVAVETADGRARVVVADDGPGMAPDVAARVFERFYRADQARSRAVGGSGLGLAIVAAVAEAHGGRATLASAVGEGTRFVVELPLGESTPPSQPVPRLEADPRR